MSAKRKNPYIVLLDEIKEWCHKVRFPSEREMWFYPKAGLEDGWRLADLYERIKAAEQLGYDVILLANDKGLIVRYRKKTPDVPWKWR